MLFALHVWAAPTNDEWQKRYSKLINEVCSKVKRKCLVRFSAYKKDDKGLPVNNLHFIAITGKVVVIGKHNSTWGNGRDFKSRQYTNPTWLDLSVIANEMIHVTGDKHHIYLEDFGVVDTRDGVQYVELYMGS